MSYQGRARGRKGRILARKAELQESLVAERAEQNRIRIFRDAYREGAAEMEKQLRGMVDVREKHEHNPTSRAVNVQKVIATFPSPGDCGPRLTVPLNVPAPLFIGDMPPDFYHERRNEVHFYAKEWGLNKRSGSSSVTLRWFTWHLDEPGVQENTDLRRLSAKLDHVEGFFAMMTRNYNPDFEYGAKLLSEAAQELRAKFGRERVEMSRQTILRQMDLVRQGQSLEWALLDGGLP